MPVLHRGVAHVAELRLPPGSLAVKTAVGIAGAGMRVVLALLAVEVGSSAARRHTSFGAVLTWPETQQRIQALWERGLQRDVDVEKRWPEVLDTLVEM